MNLRNRRSTTGHPILLDCYTHTHTHSGFVISRIRRNPRGRRFLISKYFANIKRLKISARSTTCRTVRTQDRTDLASSSVNRSATWGHAHVLTMHTKRQQTKKKKKCASSLIFQFWRCGCLSEAEPMRQKAPWRRDLFFISPASLWRYFTSWPYRRSLSSFYFHFFFFLSFSSLLPPNALHFILLSSKSPLLWQPFRWGGRVGVAGWKVGDAPRKRWKGGELLVPPFLFIFYL